MPLHADPQTDVMTDALDRLAAYAYTDGPGLATHGPMAAEALVALGHAEQVAGWVERYKGRHEVIPGPAAQVPLDARDVTSWAPALGDAARLEDWRQLFAAELTERPWASVLETWVPVLLAGYGGAFTHGLLRTAHAVRSLVAASAPESPPLFVDELAAGLAYWAGTYKVLPGRPRLQGPLSLVDALAGLPRPPEAWNPVEVGQFLRLHELAEFPASVEALGPPPSIDAALSDLSAAFARMMVANPQAHPIGLVHALTPIAGTRRLLAFVPAVSVEQVYAQLWQVNAAITAGFALVASGERDGPDSSTLPDPAELVARAVDHQDPHVLKYTEAALSEHRLRPDPAYLWAAQHVLTTTPPW